MIHVKQTDFIDELKNRHIIIFGKGKYGRNCYNHLKRIGLDVYAFSDNNTDVKEFHGIKVLPPDTLLKIKDVYIIVTPRKYEDSIIDQLLDIGISKNNVIRYTDFDRTVADVIYAKVPSEISQARCIINTERDLSVLYDPQCFEMQHWGGVSRYYYEIITGINNRKDTEVDFFQGLNISDEKFENEKEEFSSFYSQYDQTELNFDGLESVNEKWIRKFIGNKKYDIYHPTYFYDYKLNSSKKIVTTIFDMIIELFGTDLKMAERKKNLAYKSDGIITISQSAKNDILHSYDIPEDKVKVIYLANSINKSSISNRIVTEPYILYVGDRLTYKNFNRLLRAYSMSAYSHDLVLVAFGGGDFDANELDAIEKTGLSKRVLHMSGNDDILANLYENAEIFVYPSRYEGFGLPILEAMHLGTPVITSDTSSMPEVAGEAAQYFDPESVESIQVSIDRVLSDADLCGKMVKMGRKREKMFSWKKCVDETYDFYNSIIEKK